MAHSPGSISLLLLSKERGEWLPAPEFPDHAVVPGHLVAYESDPETPGGN